MRGTTWIEIATLAIIGCALTSRVTLSQSPKAGPGGKSAAAKSAAADSPAGKDEDAIRKSAKDYSAAFEKGDAKTIAAMWAEHGEYEDNSGKVLRGRESIEKEYADLFAEKKGAKIEVKIQSIRFLTPDVAVEEGILRESSAGRELPTTTRYEAIDVRDGDAWKIAQCREWGVGEDHLDDLNWLVGRWKGTGKEGELTISFAWDEKQPILVAKLAAKPATNNAAASKGAAISGAVAPTSGSIKIGFDPRRGGLHSWHGDADGSQSQAQWRRDGNRWLIDASGLTADGKATAGEFILTRIDNNNFTWRAAERTVGGEGLPDIAPVKLTRAEDRK